MGTTEIQRVSVIDSHTGGEPTRVVIAGGPELRGATLAEKRADFRARFDSFRSAVVNEPRGSDVLVGALLLEASSEEGNRGVPSCAAGVIFFNNVSVLGMCGHGTIGLIATLAYLGRLAPGEHRVETPVGVVTTRLYEDGSVSVQNVPCYRVAKDVPVSVEGIGTVVGDIAWGGNWFFLVGEHGQEIALANVEALTAFTVRIREALGAQGITGDGGQEIDHIELFAPSALPGVQSKNFVLCPGKAYDRSPCGTGTSAKLACLYADGKLREGEIWKQESVTGSVFSGFVQVVGGDVLPTIQGRAFVTAEATLLLDPADPLCYGLRTDNGA